MARNFGGTSSDYLSHGASVVGSGRAMTISAWTKGGDFSGYPVAAGILDNADAANRAIILIDPSGAAFWQYKNGGSEGNAISSNTTTTGTWAHVVGCEESSSSRFAVLNGDWANRGTNGTSVSAFTQDRTRIGSALGILPFPGDIAEVGIWDVALTQGEIEALSKGFSPLLIRPGSLVAYWPIIGRASPEIDPVGGYAMTVNGTASASAHPRVIYPRRRVAQKFTTAGGGAPSPIDGSAAGGATASGALTGTGAAAGSAAGAGATSGALTGTGALAGAAAGAATTAAEATGTGALVGTSAGEAAVVAALVGTGALAGSAAGVATVSGAFPGTAAPAPVLVARLSDYRAQRLFDPMADRVNDFRAQRIHP